MELLSQAQNMNLLRQKILEFVNVVVVGGSG